MHDEDEMLSLPLDPKTEQRLAQAALSNGTTEADYLHELLLEHLDDLEDIRIAEERLAERGPTISSEEMRKRLGLEN